MGVFAESCSIVSAVQYNTIHSTMDRQPDDRTEDRETKQNISLLQITGEEKEYQ